MMSVMSDRWCPAVFLQPPANNPGPPMRRLVVLLGLCAATWLAAVPALADRASENMDPAYMFEKARKFDLAAM